MRHVKHLFLDLEDTIITPIGEDGWQSANLINVLRIKAFIAEYKPDYVNLFSFAIWNDWERARFIDFTKNLIEAGFGITLSLIPRVDQDIIPACCAVTGMHPSKVDFSEMSNFWGKHEAFRLYMRDYFKTVKSHEGLTVEVVLIDDMVINETFTWPDMCVSGRILNVDTMPDLDGKALDDVLYGSLGNQRYTGHGVRSTVWDAATDVAFDMSTPPAK